MYYWRTQKIKASHLKLFPLTADRNTTGNIALYIVLWQSRVSYKLSSRNMAYSIAITFSTT